jgi:hypothetical protein
MDERVQDWAVEKFEDTQHQRDRIQDELADIRQVLEKIREAQRADIGTKSFPATLEAGAKAVPRKHEIIHMITQTSSTFHITPNMLHIDNIVSQTPLKYLA